MSGVFPRPGGRLFQTLIQQLKIIFDNALHPDVFNLRPTRGRHRNSGFNHAFSRRQLLRRHYDVRIVLRLSQCMVFATLTAKGHNPYVHNWNKKFENCDWIPLLSLFFVVHPRTNTLINTQNVIGNHWSMSMISDHSKIVQSPKGIKWSAVSLPCLT